MSKDQLTGKPIPKNADAKTMMMDPIAAHLDDESLKQANNKRAKEFMSNLQDKLRNLGGNQETQSPSDALNLKNNEDAFVGENEASLKGETKKMGESLSQPTYFKDAEDN